MPSEWRWIYRDQNNNCHEFESQEKMMDDIVTQFAETGENPLTECWKERDTDTGLEEVEFEATWSLSIKEKK